MAASGMQQVEERQANKERGVRFYCERCGKELWSLVDWNESYLKTYTLKQLMAQCLCSDCILAEAREDNRKEQNDQDMEIPQGLV